MNASPQPQRRPQNRAPRPRQVQTHNSMPAEVQSDSNLPSSTTPKPKRTRQRQNDSRAASTSDTNTATTGPTYHASAKAQRAKPMPPPQYGQAGGHATPLKSAAYAGPTFHASPAASALPVPKFFSKSVPTGGAESGLQSRLDHEDKPASASPSPPTEQSTPGPLARERSPLDFLLNADREEKAKRQSTTALNALFTDNDNGATSRDPHSPFTSKRTPPENNKGLFMLELDSSDSPAAQRSASTPQTTNQSEADKAAYTQSLKKLLNLQPVQQQSSPVHHFSTPQQQRAPGPADSPLHYGNRNLSPLFQAARNDQTPHKQFSPFQHATPYSPVSPGQVHGATRFDDAQSPFQRGVGGVSLQQKYVSHPQQVQARPQVQGPAQAQAESPDVRDMEAKLRGMLKLGF